MLDDNCFSEVASYLESNIHTFAFANKTIYHRFLRNRDHIARLYITNVFPDITHITNAYKNYLRLLYTIYTLNGTMRGRVNFLFYIDYAGPLDKYRYLYNDGKPDIIHTLIANKYTLKPISGTDRKKYLFIYDRLTKRLSPYIISPFICNFLLTNKTMLSMWDDYNMSMISQDNSYSRISSYRDILNVLAKVYFSDSNKLQNTILKKSYFTLMYAFMHSSQIFTIHNRIAINTLLLNLLVNNNDDVVHYIIKELKKSKNISIMSNIYYTPCYENYTELDDRSVEKCKDCRQVSIIKAFENYSNIIKHYSISRSVITNEGLEKFIKDYLRSKLYIMLEWFIDEYCNGFNVQLTLKDILTYEISGNMYMCKLHTKSYTYIDYISLLSKVTNKNDIKLIVEEIVVDYVKKGKEIHIFFTYENDTFQKLTCDYYSEIVKLMLKTALDVDNIDVVFYICQYYSDNNYEKFSLKTQDIIDYIIEYSESINRFDLMNKFKKIRL